jgi:hypothetical protein
MDEDLIRSRIRAPVGRSACHWRSGRNCTYLAHNEAEYPSSRNEVAAKDRSNQLTNRILNITVTRSNSVTPEQTFPCEAPSPGDAGRPCYRRSRSVWSVACLRSSMAASM